MANTDAPRGFRVANTQGGAPFSGALNKYRIASGLATTLCEGDIVTLLATGYITRAGTGIVAGTGLPLGIFKGVQYLGTDGTPKFDNKWISGTVTSGAADAVALICDDPTVVVEAKFTGVSTVPLLADVGATYDLTDAAGNTATGVSAQGVTSTPGTAANKFRFIGFVERPDNDVTATTGAYALGRFAFAAHNYKATAGV